MSNKTYIRSVKELRLTKAELKLRIIEQERELIERLHRLPAESVQMALGGIIPYFLNKRATATGWLVAKSVMGLFKKSSSKKATAKESLFATVKRWLFINAAKLVYGLFAK